MKEKGDRMISIAILGFGTVGSGVAEVLERNRKKIRDAVGCDVTVKYVLDKRDLSDTAYASLAVTDIDVILNDPEVSIVCEMLGGTQPAYDYSMAALRAGKNVVTSNKEVVARFGVSLLKTAQEMGVSYLYEASVGGGIPVLHAMDDSLKGCEIRRIDGILNGTTNYILTRMHDCKSSFEDALDEARRLGYAEANPTADISGADACRKICILSALAWGELVPGESVPCEGITEITADDNEFAILCDGVLKLVATAKKSEEGLQLSVSPCVVMNENPLASAKGVFNAVKFDAGDLGDVMFYGMGAGKFPTASAVISDIMAIVRKSSNRRDVVFSEYGGTVPAKEDFSDAYCLAVTADTKVLLERIPTLVVLGEAGDTKYVLCENVTVGELMKTLDGIPVLKCMRAIV